jgi:inner membrane transporter RhtA
MNLSFYLAIERIPLGIAVALEFVGPLTVSVLASRRPSDFAWACLAAAGVFLVLPLAGAAGTDLRGAAFALLAGGFWALYIVFGKRAGRMVPGGAAAAFGMIVAACTVLPVGVLRFEQRALNGQVMLLAFTVAVMSSAIPYSLEMVALRAIPARTFGILMSLEPALAASVGWLVLGERLSVLQWSAIASIVVASVGSSSGAADAI